MANESEEDQQAAAGGASVLEILNGLEAQGYSGQFAAGEDGSLDCLAGTHTFQADAVDPDELLRVEGASDPDDMAAVAGLTCPVCGSKGTVVLKFGPEASLEDQQILAAFAPPEGA